jgi:hypothetical protein
MYGSVSLLPSKNGANRDGLPSLRQTPKAERNTCHYKLRYSYRVAYDS